MVLDEQWRKAFNPRASIPSFLRSAETTDATVSLSAEDQGKYSAAPIAQCSIVKGSIGRKRGGTSGNVAGRRNRRTSRLKGHDLRRRQAVQIRLIASRVFEIRIHAVAHVAT
jgi:hypothetical protein